jgi:hypothetical protein
VRPAICSENQRFSAVCARHEPCCFRPCASRALDDDANKEDIMGKYFLAWLLGVPAGLLVLIYVFTHL